MKNKWMLMITLIIIGIFIVDLGISYYRYFQSTLTGYPSYLVAFYRGVDYAIPFAVIAIYWLLRNRKKK